jgi:GNAT superfamily N-acetyltransferase
MKPTIEIRPVVVAEHYEVICKMMHDLHRNEHALHDKTAEWPDIEADYMRHVIRMQEEQDGLFLLAYLDEQPAGFIFGYLEDQDESRIEVYTGRELYISDGYVVPEHRRQGIYHRLNAHMERYFTERGVKRILRYTLVRNTGMRQFLDNEGYAVTRLLYEKWL